jgi:23S rRNA (pseudouridine1915-N3)-methyltransferase
LRGWSRLGRRSIANGLRIVRNDPLRTRVPRLYSAAPRARRMSREIVILWAGRHRRSRFEEAIAEYRQRLEPSLRVTDRWVRSKATGEDAERRRAEGQALLEALPPRSWVIALDPGGRMLDSEAFAERLGRLEETWPHAVAFVLGSDLGLARDVLDRAREKLSLGPMTLPHELARLVLYEQIYRAVTIRSGINYHR